MNSNTIYLIKKVVRHEMKRFQSKKHSIGAYKVNKISLSCFDDKKYVLDDGIRHRGCKKQKDVTDNYEQEKILTDNHK